jgi:hypothetical protein
MVNGLADGASRPRGREFLPEAGYRPAEFKESGLYPNRRFILNFQGQLLTIQS